MASCSAVRRHSTPGSRCALQVGYQIENTHSLACCAAGAVSGVDHGFGGGAVRPFDARLASLTALPCGGAGLARVYRHAAGGRSREQHLGRWVRKPPVFPTTALRSSKHMRCPQPPACHAGLPNSIWSSPPSAASRGPSAHGRQAHPGPLTSAAAHRCGVRAVGVGVALFRVHLWVGAAHIAANACVGLNFSDDVIALGCAYRGRGVAVRPFSAAAQRRPNAATAPQRRHQGMASSLSGTQPQAPHHPAWPPDSHGTL